MDSQQHIYELIKATYANTDVGRVDQSRDFETQLIVLCEFISIEPTTDKDVTGTRIDFEKLQVSVFNKDYDTALTAARDIRDILEPIKNAWIRETEFDDRIYIYEPDTEIHRFINRFTIHIHD